MNIPNVHLSFLNICNLTAPAVRQNSLESPLLIFRCFLNHKSFIQETMVRAEANGTLADTRNVVSLSSTSKSHWKTFENLCSPLSHSESFLFCSAVD
jgi:hypothetical protein